MIFKLNFKAQNILTGADLAHEFMRSYLGCILEKSSFTYTDLDPVSIFNHISSTFLSDCLVKNYVSINLITPKWRFSKLNATTFKGVPRTVFYNTYKVNSFTPPEVCRTLVHEYGGHIMGFNHGNNFNQSSVKKLESVPIWLGSQAYDWTKGRS